MFVDDGMIVSIKPRAGTAKPATYRGETDGSYLNFPMVCLVNGGSASASEIVSACLQDHGRAVIMGSRSFGKGSVQTIHSFEEKSILKLTTATFWRPSGRNLNKASTPGKDTDEWGVTPNKGFELKLSRKEDGDLFEHHPTFDVHIGVRTQRFEHDVGNEIHRQRQVVVEHLGVETRVLLGGESVHLTTDRVDLFREVPWGHPVADAKLLAVLPGRPSGDRGGVQEGNGARCRGAHETAPAAAIAAR